MTLQVTARRHQGLALQEVRKVGEQPIGVNVHRVAVFAQIRGVTGMYFARPVVPLLVANIDGRSEVSTFGSPLRTRSMSGSSIVILGGWHVALKVSTERTDLNPWRRPYSVLALRRTISNSFWLCVAHGVTRRRVEAVGGAQPQVPGQQTLDGWRVHRATAERPACASSVVW